LLATVFQVFNVCWAAAMSAGTPVSVFMAISQSSCVFVLGLSYCLLAERLTPTKLVSVAICVAGVVVVSMQQQNQDAHSATIIGLLWSFGYTGLNAVYMLLWGVKVGKKVAKSRDEDITLIILGKASVHD
jgi:drug/metabolite transporter (DMT)-like permease